MMNKEQTELRQEQINSLKWAVEELEKEKDAISGRWEKTNRTSELKTSLEEALCTQSSLSERITEMKGDLSRFGGKGEEALSAEELENQKGSLEERISIAMERLSVLEQEQELERIALRFRGEPCPTEEEELVATPDEHLSKELETKQKSMEEITIENRLQSIDSDQEKESTNRLHATEEEQLVTTSSGPLSCTEATSQGLRQASAELDLDPEYLLDKSIQAVLRMIERNKNRVIFPLEVKQVDSID